LALLVTSLAERIHQDIPAGDIVGGPEVRHNCIDEATPDAREVLPTTVDADKKPSPMALKPFEEPEASKKYREVGCLSLEEHDEGNGGRNTTEKDLFCRDFKPTGDGVKCRSGLPFFRKALERDGDEFVHCMMSCLGAGLDLFGLVERNTAGELLETVECRCGAGKENKQAWNGIFNKTYLIPDLQRVYPKNAESEVCPVRIGQYDVEWMKKHGDDGTPISLMHMNMETTRYKHQIFHGSADFDAVEDGKTGEAFQSPFVSSRWESSYVEVSLHDVVSSGSNRTLALGPSSRRKLAEPSYKRDCVRERCAAGQAWGNRIFFAFTSDVGEITLRAFIQALRKIRAHIPCIEFVWLSCTNSLGEPREGQRCEERDFKRQGARPNQARVDGVILVGNRHPDDCYCAGLGFPGRYGVRFINLGWCNSNLHIGDMMHEVGHALGMNHEMKRPDAVREYHGAGPHVVINEMAIQEKTIRWTHKQYPHYTDRQVRLEVEVALYQYEADDTTYTGSVARGRTPFDFESIMLYSATDEMWSICDHKEYRLHSDLQLHHCFDHKMGQRVDLSSLDVLQLRDMYGCLPAEILRCPAIYGSKPADKDGDCKCPSGTFCYQNGKKGCPWAKAERKHPRYFRLGCKDCRCVAPRCPAGAGSIQVNSAVAPPDRDGDCKCPERTVCRRGSGYCPSSRGNSDWEYFSDSCHDCICRKTCPAGSNSMSHFVDSDGNCVCPERTVCVKGRHSVGCKITAGSISVRWFKASCNDCVCEKIQPPAPPTCQRSPGEGAVEGPDRQGDCTCKNHTVCIKGNRDSMCRYSGGRSSQYYSAECPDCHCTIPKTITQTRWLQKPLYSMHERCSSASAPTKCGATQVEAGNNMWDLPRNLRSFECGRCTMALQPSHNWGTCERTTADGEERRLSPHYTLVGSSSNEDLCCQWYTCKQHRQDALDRKDPCKGFICGENAVCTLVGMREPHDTREPVCSCKLGFEFTDDGVDCVQEVPEGSQCCTFNAHYMWVPNEFLEEYWFLGCIKTGKKMCP